MLLPILLAAQLALLWLVIRQLQRIGGDSMGAKRVPITPVDPAAEMDILNDALKEAVEHADRRVNERWLVEDLGMRRYRIAPESNKQASHTITPTRHSLRIALTPHAITWVASQLGSHCDREFVFRVASCRIGVPAEEGWRSPVADDGMFVLTSPVLRPITLSFVSIVSEAQYLLYVEGLVRMWKGLPNAPDYAPLLEPKSPDYVSGGHIGHNQAERSHEAGDMDCTIGLPSDTIDHLTNVCLQNRNTTIHLHGYTNGLTATVEYGIARDLIVQPNQVLRFDIAECRITAQFTAQE